MKTTYLTAKTMKALCADLPKHRAPYMDDGRAQLHLDEKGTPSLTSYSRHFGGTPADVWHGVTRMWEIPVLVDGYALYDYLTGAKVLDLLRRVARGYSCDWDGNNYVGELDDDASDASEELQDGLSALHQWGTATISDVIGFATSRECFDGHSSFDDVVDAVRAWAYEDMECVISDGEDAVETLLDLVLSDYQRGWSPTNLMREALTKSGTARQLERLEVLDAAAADAEAENEA